MAINSAGYVNPRNPIAQSFFVDEAEGIYLTKVDLYFSSRTTDAPVSMHIRPMDNGLPSAVEIMPQSTVYVNGNLVNTSADATSATTFQFEEPIYLTGKKEYAIVLTTPHPAYEVYIAQIDEFEVGTTAKRVARNPALGSLFYSHNGATWTAAQEQDLKFKLYRAEFPTTYGGVAFLHNAAVGKELLHQDPISTDSASSSVTISHVAHGMLVGDTVHITGLDSASTIGGIKATSILGNRTITAIDWSGYKVTADSAATSSDLGGGTTVLASRNIGFCNAYANLGTIVPPATVLTTGAEFTTGKSYAGTETAYQRMPEFVKIPLGETISLPAPYVVANTAIETSELGAGEKSLRQNVFLKTNKSHVAPMIDLQRASMTLIDNVIDKQDSAATSGFNVPLEFTNETAPFGGTSAAKHITTVISLDEDAVGLKILFAAYRPSGSDFLVYYRTVTSDNVIEETNWTLLSEETNNPTDERLIYRDYRYIAGGQGGNLDAFSKYQVKIVMRSTNKARVPLIKDLRVIALSV